MSAAKRPRLNDSPEDALVVPKDVIARIKRSLAGPEPTAVSAGSGCFSLLSWNVDGIDDTSENDRMRRCLAVAEHVAATQPIAVFLQEAVPPQLQLLAAPQVLGQHYDFVCPENPRMPYYNVIMLHKRRTRTLSEPRTTDFATSQMGRHFLAIDVVVDGYVNSPLTFVTTHLESTKTEKAERVKQLTQILETLAKTGVRQPPPTVVAAGDLNVRDEEVVAARKQVRANSPRVDDIVDAWIWCGSPKAHEHTWDTSVNTNLGCLFKSRCRFDRCYFSSPGATTGRGGTVHKSASATPARTGTGWLPSKFELVGRSKVEGLGRFPSDHWGVQTAWRVAEKSAGGTQLRDGHIVQTTDSVADSNATVTPVPAMQLSDDERAKRRELALKQAMSRQVAASSHGIGDVRKLLKKQTQGQPVAGLKLNRAESADSAAAETSSGSTTTGSSSVSESVVSEAHGAAADGADEESEEAMLAKAISLSLQNCSEASPLASVNKPASASTTGSVGSFKRLSASSSTVSSGHTVIDLDD